MLNRKRWPLVLASVPLWPIGSLLAFATLARLQLGYWPRNGGPDPGQLKWLWMFDVAILPMFLLAPTAILVAVAAAIHGRYAGRDDWRLLLTVASFAVLIVWIRFDPGDFITWWMD